MRNESKFIFENRLDILIYAVHTPGSFNVTDIFEAVLDTTRMTIRRCLKDLVDVGYLEKVSVYDFKATDKAKELFGAKT